MGLTSEAHEWGMRDGVAGEPIPRFSDKLGEYALPYRVAYARGFLLRKAGATEVGKATGEQLREEQRLWALCYMPRYRVRVRDRAGNEAWLQGLEVLDEVEKGVLW